MLIPDVDNYEPNDIYIGSTCNPMAREECHNNLLKNGCCSRKLIEKYKAPLILIPLVEVYNIYKNSLEKLEQKFLDKTICINERRAYLSKEDKSLLNKEYLNEYRKEDAVCCHCGAKTKLNNIQRHKRLNCTTSPSQQLL
jgi:hypothetical protein